MNCSSTNPTYQHWRCALTLEDAITEAWSQGFLVGAIIILIMITISNFRAGVLLHKLILIELVFVLGHGTFIFCRDPTYGWYLSSTAVFLYSSWYLHNVIAWMKNKPFLPRWGSRLYIGSVILVFPYWIAEMYFNFQYFNGLGNNSFTRLRPWEALARDPWWIFTTCNLIYVIKRDYNLSLVELVRASPRFGLLMVSMVISIIFILTDTVVSGARLGSNSGINPYWKLAAVFKCAADALFLDDFKKVLDTLINTSLKTIGVQNPALSSSNGGPPAPTESQCRDFALNHVSTNGSSPHTGYRKPSTSPFHMARHRFHHRSDNSDLPPRARRHTISAARLHIPHFPHFQFPRFSEDSGHRASSSLGATRASHQHNGSVVTNGHGPNSQGRSESGSHSPAPNWWDHHEHEMRRELRAAEEGPRPRGLTAAPQSHRLPIQSNGIHEGRLHPGGDRTSVVSRDEEITFLTSAV